MERIFNAKKKTQIKVRIKMMLLIVGWMLINKGKKSA
ncbi:MAG: hypothetical protein AOA65_0986 [Candidatus Bathyarchaeota archaeon BA1]|nr:MAG: hypothetical protein AOA65_0986 [Candidatus Bathyarchaeota archaeon BA1]